MALQQLHTVPEAVAWLRSQGVSGTLRSDSRSIRVGDAFIAWPGRRNDGRRHVAAAWGAGAAACVVEAEGVEGFDFAAAPAGAVASLPGLRALAGPLAAGWFGEPSRRLRVVAVTGTNGKTSSACWVAEALSQLGMPCGIVGTLGVGRPGALAETGLTTPDPVALQAAFADFVLQGLVACAIEASSIGLVEQRLAGTAIEVALFTNLTQDHLDHHGDMAAYWAAKRRLFDWPGLRAAVINVDDAHGAQLADDLADEQANRGLDLWTCALHGPARLRATQLRHEAGGLAFEVLEGDQVQPLRTTLIGEHNAYNLLGVLGCLRALGLPLADAVRAAAAVHPVPGRLQPVQPPRSASDTAPEPEPLLLVDYAHTPDALEKALRALRPLARARGGRLWCLFGCGGDRDPIKRPLMGAIAQRDADRVVLTSDNPRSEVPGRILSQILVGMPCQQGVDVIEDRAEAIAHAVATAAAQDVVLLAGKGHETYQEVGGVKRPFSDLDAAAAALASRRGMPRGAGA